MRTVNVSLAVAAGAAISLCAAANGQIFLAVKGDQLFRTDGVSVERFTLGDSLHSLSRLSDGRIVGISNTLDQTTQMLEVHELLNPLGIAPSLNQIAKVPERYPTLSDVRGRIFATRTIDVLAELSPATFAELNVVGNMGTPQGIGGSGYDRVNDKLYFTNFATGSFYEVDYTNANAQVIGPLGLNFENQGGEFFGGKYYTALEDIDGDRFVLGQVNTATGAFTPILVLHNGLSTLPGTVGLAVIPGPGALAVFGLGLLVAARRRRSS